MKHGDGPQPTTSRRRDQLLVRFEGLLRSRAVPRGFISPRDAGRIMERHIMDSLRAVRCLLPSDRELFDVGAGAGLPGIPVAIAEPERHVILVEPMAKRAAFLELVAEQLELTNVEVRVARAEDVGAHGDVSFARALASPLRAWGLIEPLLRPGGRLIYFGGRSWGAAVESELRANGVSVHVCDQPQFAWQGPVVIMARTSR